MASNSAFPAHSLAKLTVWFPNHPLNTKSRTQELCALHQFTFPGLPRDCITPKDGKREWNWYLRISSDPPPLQFPERYVPCSGAWPTSRDHVVLIRKPMATASEIWIITSREKKNVLYYVQGLRKEVRMSDSSTRFGTDFTDFG